MAKGRSTRRFTARSSSSATLEGFADLERKLEALPGKIAKRATGRAMRAASKLVADEIELRAPRKSGGLAGSVKIQLRNRNLTGLAEYRDAMQAGGSIQQARASLRGARSGGESAGTRVLVRVMLTAPHAHLVEFGTDPRFHKSTGKSTGTMPAHPFVRPAWDSKSLEALGTIKTVLTAEVMKAAKES